MRAIQSVLSQSWQDYEIIVVSDGSADNTQSLLEGMTDPRIRYFKHQTPKGASAARNTGIRNARGKYLAFLDDDDEWTPDKLELQVPLLMNSGGRVGLVYAWMKYMENGKTIRIYNPSLRGRIFEDMLDKQAIGNSSSAVIKREVVDKIGLFDERLWRGNDGDYWRRISKIYEVDYVPRVLVKVHVGDWERLSGVSRVGILREIYAFQSQLEKFEPDYRRCPDKKVIIFSKLCTDYLYTGQLRQCLGQIAKIISSEASPKWKAVALCLIIKRFLSLLKVYINRT